MNRYHLTPREQQIVRLILTGRTALKEIAADLGISHFTARNYLKRIERKTDTHDRTQVVLRLLGLMEGGPIAEA